MVELLKTFWELPLWKAFIVCILDDLLFVTLFLVKLVIFISKLWPLWLVIIIIILIIAAIKGR